jgi:hypothetical protein
MWNTCLTCNDDDSDSWYELCNQYVAINGPDCDDSASGVNPGAAETPGDGVDQNCDSVDLCYTDADNDNYGTSSTVNGLSLSCAADANRASVSTDCNDGNAAINPAASEVAADGVDQNCDSVDLCYVDSDDDNYGTTSTVNGLSLNCAADANRAPVSTDCNDSLASAHPGAAEAAGDGVDQDCDSVDLCYTDADNDNYGTTPTINGLTLNCTTDSGRAPNNTDCNDASAAVFPAAPELCDSVDNQCPGDPGYGTVDEGCGPLDTDGDGLADADETTIWFTSPTNPDTDGDLINDYKEAVTRPCLDELDPDTDNDGLNDGVEDADHDAVRDPAETDPCDPDSDRDNLTDGMEGNTIGSDPLAWDTDRDGLPDVFEWDNRAASPSLNFGDSADGKADFDADLNPNAHEYWNGSSLWTVDPKDHFAHPFYGCAYWGDATGDCWVNAVDFNALRDRVRGAAVSYAGVLPPTGWTHDLDANGFVNPVDLNILRNLISGAVIFSLDSSPVGLAVDAAPATVAVGDTAHITISVHNVIGSQTPGFAIEFWVDGSSTASAAIFGGDGEQSGLRYDYSGPNLTTSASTIILRPNTPGSLIIQARIPSCGAPGLGRNAPTINLVTPITIAVTP